MKSYSATLSSGEAIHYTDRKRWLWILAVIYPLQPLPGMWLHSMTGNQLWLLLPLLLNYGIAPIIDWLVGENRNNPPEEVVIQLNGDAYYRRLSYAVVPLHYVSMIGVAWYIGTHDLSWWAVLGLAVVAGIAAGLAINTGHELGHKNSFLAMTPLGGNYVAKRIFEFLDRTGS